MNKTSFLKWVVAALVLLNLGTLSILFTQRRPPHREGPRKAIIARLHFDAAQVEAYDKMVEAHRSGIHQKQQEIFEAKAALYGLLASTDFSKKDSLVEGVGHLQEEIELVHFAHFQEIKSLCRDTQVADFDKLASELARFFGYHKDMPENGRPAER